MSNLSPSSYHLDDDGFIFRELITDGREICVTPQLYGAAIITIGPAGGQTYDHQWMYSAEVGGEGMALFQAALWVTDFSIQEEPRKWVRTDYKATPGKWRRRPDGEPESEYEAD